MKVLGPVDTGRDKELDEKALTVFIKALEILGGPRKIIEHRNITWVPSLMTASYAVVLRDMGRTTREIAETLGTTEATVRRMLTSDPQEVMKRIMEGEEVDDHIAGGLAKEAWSRIKRGERVSLALELSREAAEALEVAWAVEVLVKIRGLDFPVEKEDLLERLKGTKIAGRPAEEVLEKLKYPIRSPAELLKQIKAALS